MVQSCPNTFGPSRLQALAGRWTRRTLPALLLATALAGAMPEGSALAQTNSTREQVQREMDTTQQAIERAREHVQENACTRGATLLENARKLQREAVSEFLGNTRPGDRRALLLTREARELVLRAVQNCQVEFQAHDTMRKLFESTEDLVLEARSRPRVTEDPEASRLLEAGIEQLQKAQEAYRAEEFRRAIRLVTVARNLVERALQRASVQAHGLAERTAAAIERTDEVIAEARASQGADPDPMAMELIEQAERNQTRARELLSDRRAALALRTTELARTQALEATWIDREAPERDRIARAIDAVETMISDLASDIRAGGDAEAQSLLEKAEEQLGAARTQLAEGRESVAARNVRLSASLLRRAAERSGLR